MLTLSVSECDLILLEAGGDLQQAEADLKIWRRGEGAGLLRVCLSDISLRDQPGGCGAGTAAKDQPQTLCWP